MIPATSGSDPRNPELVARLQGYMARQGLKDNTQDRAILGKQLGYGDGTAVYRYLAGKPEGDLAKFESRLTAFLDNELRLEGGGALVTSDDAFINPSMFAFLNQVRKHCRIGVAHGPAGIGKSCACRAYTAAHKSTTLYVHVWSWASGKGGLARELAKFAGVKAKGEAVEIALARHFKDRQIMLILDNAQRLTNSARNWLADFFDFTGTPIALVGNPEIEAQWSRIDQHTRRIGLRRDVSVDLFDSKPERNTAKATATHLLRQHLPEAQGNTAATRKVLELLTRKGSGACGAVVSHASLARMMLTAPGSQITDPAQALDLAATQLLSAA